jgi:hypothetical protein
LSTPSPHDLEAFGPGSQLYQVRAEQLTGKLDGTVPDLTYDSFSYYNSKGSAATARYLAPVELPAGGVVTDVTCYVRDFSATNNVSVALADTTHNVSSNGNNITFLANFSSTGSSGYQEISGGALSATIRYNEGDLRHVYSFVADISEDTALRECRITWHRSISPAPLTATFGDVPTDYTYFRGIEALVASGITAGCGSGNFCPNQFVTRGEMAAFLARALGLHWPM